MAAGGTSLHRKIEKNRPTNTSTTSNSFVLVRVAQIFNFGHGATDNGRKRRNNFRLDFSIRPHLESAFEEKITSTYVSTRVYTRSRRPIVKVKYSLLPIRTSRYLHNLLVVKVRVTETE